MTFVRRSMVALMLAGLLAAGVGALLMWQNGYRMYAVKTGSMSPAYPTGALVIDAPATPGATSVGDVVTFRVADNALVTHRVYEHTPTGVTTKGDANRTPDAWTIVPQNIIGVVTAGIAGAGYVLVFFQQPTGALSLAVLGISGMLAWSIFFPAKDETREGESHHGPSATREVALVA